MRPTNDNMVFVLAVMVILNAKTPWIILVCKQALYLGNVVESHARATRERRWSPLEIESLLVGKITFLSTELTTKKIRPLVLWCYLLVFTKTALFFIFENASLLNIPVCRKKEIHKRLQMRWQTHHNCFRKTGEFTIFFQMEKYRVLWAVWSVAHALGHSIV